MVSNETGTRSLRASSPASSPDWLNPLSFRRLRCRGTGTTRSGTGNPQPAWAVFSNSTRGGAHSIWAPNLNWWIRARIMPSWNTADLAVSKWKTDSMHSPHRWSSESGASLKGLPHIGQRGDTAQGISFQHRRHQELWGRLSILWQPAQFLGRHKSRRIDP